MAENPYLVSAKTHGGRARRGWVPTCVALVATAAALSSALLAPGGRTGVTAELTSEVGTHVTAASPDCTLTEAVTVEGMAPGSAVDVTVEVEGTGDTTGHVTSRRLAPSPKGRIEVPVDVDTSGIAGGTVVAYVTVSCDGEIVYESRDDANVAQTVRVPSVDVSVTQRDASVVIARVDYANLEPGVSYGLSCSLEDRLMGTAVDRTTVTTEFVAEGESGSIEVSVPADASALAGRDVRLEAEVTDAGITVAACRGADAPCVAMPKIQAQADDTTLSLSGDALTVSRPIAYSGLEEGVTYAIASTITGASGEEVAAHETRFKATSSMGTVTVTQALDVKSAQGELTFTDKLVDGDGETSGTTPIAESAVTTLIVPTLSTSTVGTHTGIACEPATGDALLQGVASYEGLVEGVAYELTGTISIVGEGGVVLGPLGGADGTPVTTTVPFVAAEGGSGTVEISYTLDASELSGTCLMASERITRDGMVVATADGNLISIPSLSVMATGAATGTHECTSGEVTLEVSYGNLPVCDGLECVCTLLDASTGLPAMGPSGDEATVRTAIAGGIDSGTTHLTAAVDADSLVGSSVVAIARMESEGVTLATTADDWDDHARVWLPRVGATIRDASTSTAVACLGTATPLVADVTLEGIERDTSHKVTLALVDAETGDPVTDETGTPAGAVVALQAQGTTAEAQATLTIDSTALVGHTIAVEATLGEADDASAVSEITSDGTNVSIPAATVVRGTGEDGSAIAEVTCTGLAPDTGYIVAVTAREGTDSAARVEVPVTAEDGTATAQVALEGLVRDDTDTISAEVTIDGYVVARATEEDDSPTTVPIDPSSRRNHAMVRPNLRRTEPVAKGKDGRSLLVRVVAVTFAALVATGVLATRGMRAPRTQDAS